MGAGLCVNPLFVAANYRWEQPDAPPVGVSVRGVFRDSGLQKTACFLEDFHVVG